jgi:hypothetical protein
MPPRIAPNRGVPRRGRPSHGDNPGGERRGSQLGGPSSNNTPSDAPGSPQSAATTHVTNIETPSQIPAPIANHPTARGQPFGNRGRGAGRGDPDRGQFSGRNRGRGRGRGGAPSTPSGVETTPTSPITGETASTASFSQDHQSAFRGHSYRGRGGYRGTPRGNPFDSQSSAFRGRSSRGGRGGVGGGFVASSSDTTGSPSGIPGKSYYSTKLFQLRIFKFLLINPRSYLVDEIVTFGAKRPGYGSGGRSVNIIVNAFSTTVPNTIIYQYDGEIPFWTIP